MGERFYGAEVRELEIGGDVVRDVKAATAIIIGTFPVQDVHEAADFDAYVNTSILIRRREDIAKNFGVYTEGYTLAWILDAIFDQDQGKGVGTIEVINVFDPRVHKDGANEPDPSLVTNLDIIGGFDAAGQPSGLHHAYATFQTYGWFPTFVAAPGYHLATGVREEIEVICNKLWARSYIDAPAGVRPQDVVAARGPDGPFDFQTDNPRTNLCYPMMEVADPSKPNATVVEPYSATLIGIHLSTIVEDGYHHSPSNRPITGRKPAQTIVYTPGQNDDDMTLLRDAGIVTTKERWGKGPHTAGNNSAAFPASTDIRDTVIKHRLTLDLLHRSVIFYLDEQADTNANSASIAYHEGVILDALQAKTTGLDPVILGVRFSFNREKMTVQDYADNRIFFTLAVMFVGLFEWMTVESYVDLNLAANPLGIASGENAIIQPA